MRISEVLIIFCPVQVLGETPVEDYLDGDSEVYFSTDSIDVTGIAPSSLANCGKSFVIVT